MTSPAVDAGEPTFYARLAPFTEFAAAGDAAFYVDAPEDWLLVLADIEGSTEAARAGRYKDVNLIGAACITATLNVTRGLDLPYVFGGDGAVVLVPPERREAVADALRRTRKLAAEGFGLTLRIGIVPVAEALRRGRRVRVARFELSPNNHLAMFAGGGMELAESLLKDPIGGAAFRLEPADDEAPPDLEGLSCRWQPYGSLRGRMLSLLVRALDADAQALYREIIGELALLLCDAPEYASPIRPANMRFVWPPAGLGAEALATRGHLPVWRRRAWLWFESFLQTIAERFELRIGPYDAPVYREEVRRNSDHRKLADALQMVVDCTDAENAAIEAYLEGLRAQGRIVYGLHRADRAMMTCLVFSLEQSRHVHFIDGADGGYALAALQLKAQLKALASAASPAEPAA